MKIYLDLDGVFAHFDKKVTEVMGGNWDSHSNKIWGPVSRVDRLFRHLELIPEALRIITMLNHNDLDFLTALQFQTVDLGSAKDERLDGFHHHISKTIQVNTMVVEKIKPNF